MRLVQYKYLMKLRDHIPRNVLDKSWLQPPSILEEVRFAASPSLCADLAQVVKLL